MRARLDKRMSRALNTASAADLKCLLLELLDAESFSVSADSDYAGIASTHSEFLVRLMSVTDRPTAGLVQEGMAFAFPDLSQGRLRTFAALISGCVSHYRHVAKRVVSGEKLAVGPRRLVAAIKAASCPQQEKSKAASCPQQEKSRRRLVKNVSEAKSVEEVAPTRKLKQHDSVLSVASSVEAVPSIRHKPEAPTRPQPDLSIHDEVCCALWAGHQ